ncbi:hypothetical protein DPMN_081273 [Dreissena polymorpha]|uniref:C2H2-type domain-containing protein n=1 Tax=Dreissena polymorpha TaxID=45954 RepID=A0A9D4BGD1_DREPO|nr:hypothetical protein DPMN_081273 [Dreissena polymorpha]
MTKYPCDICERTYKHQRSLKRHKQEYHVLKNRCWKCVEEGCSSRFISRGYISRHLIMCNNFTKQAACEKAVSATRETNATTATYYEDISSDDSTFDLIQEIEDFSSPHPHFTTKELNFDIDDYLDEVHLDVRGEVDIAMDQPSV